jgi:serine/threonine-protein kinase
MIGKEIGPYRIIEKIGQGGMGIVFKGLHVKLEQEVAIKVLAPELSQDPSMRERFIKEAKIQAKISHPNVVNVLNYVEEGSDLFLVMEFLQGETLDNRLKRLGWCPDAVNACISVLSALEFMHSRGIIHRDIKPGNIMFLDDGSVKVMDFGIAKVAGERGQTKTGMRVGTLWYMSPEQIKGEEATVSSDLYSVGVTLYQMITGRVPFGGESEYMVMKAHLEEQPIPPWEINGTVSKEFGRIILKALAKDKKDRYQNARDFAADLRSASGRTAGETVIAAAVPVQRKFDLSRIKATISRVDRRILLVILLCLGVLLVVIGLLLAFQHKKESVFPVTKTLPSAPAPLPVQQPVPNVAAPPAPVTPDQGIAKEEPVSPAPVKKHEKRLAKKKRSPGRKEVSSGDSHDKSDSVDKKSGTASQEEAPSGDSHDKSDSSGAWKKFKDNFVNKVKSTFKGGEKKEDN